MKTGLHTQKVRYSDVHHVMITTYLPIGTVTKLDDGTWTAAARTAHQSESQTVTAHKTKKAAVEAVVQAVLDNGNIIHGRGLDADKTRDVSRELARLDA